MTEQDLRDELVTLLTDGPTSGLLSWAFERILRHPEQYARLRAEVDAGKDDAYLEAVAKETMRVCPAVPIVVRKLLAPMELGGYTIRPVRPSRRARTWSTAATTSTPSRCASGLSASWSERACGSPIPTRGLRRGVRRCLAASYAQLLRKQVIATVVSEVELRSVLRARPQERDRVRGP